MKLTCNRYFSHKVVQEHILWNIDLFSYMHAFIYYNYIYLENFGLIDKVSFPSHLEIAYAIILLS